MVIPVGDQNPAHRFPLITYALIAINAVVFLFSPVSGLNPEYGTGVNRVCAQVAFFDEYGAIPRELVTNREIPPQPVGVRTDEGVVRCRIPPYDKAPVFSALTAMFVHGGWLHLLGNMLFLFVFGNNVEDRMGRLRFLLFYLACGYVATYAHALVYAASTEPLVGASGAIAGVLGAYLYLFPRAKVITLIGIIPLRLPAWVVLGFWFFLQWLYFRRTGVVGEAGVAYLAHVVGFLAGFLYAVLALNRRPTPPAPPRPYGWHYRR